MAAASHYSMQTVNHVQLPREVNAKLRPSTQAVTDGEAAEAWGLLHNRRLWKKWGSEGCWGPRLPFAQLGQARHPGTSSCGCPGGGGKDLPPRPDSRSPLGASASHSAPVGQAELYVFLFDWSHPRFFRELVITASRQTSLQQPWQQARGQVHLTEQCHRPSRNDGACESSGNGCLPHPPLLIPRSRRQGPMYPQGNARPSSSSNGCHSPTEKLPPRGGGEMKTRVSTGVQEQAAEVTSEFSLTFLAFPMPVW